MNLETVALLSVVTLATSTLSGIVGMGGGVTLLAVMAVMLPPPLVVPIHGVVQLASNGTRALLFLRYVERPIFALYIVPAMVGVWFGADLYLAGPLPWFRPAVGVFILLYLLTLVRAPSLGRLPLWTFAPLGLVTGALASLVGATGPMIAPFFLRDDLTKEQVIGTKAAIQITTHGAKIPAFLALGFAYGAYWHALLPLTAAAVAGTFLGKKLLGRLPERVFRNLFATVLGLVALYLIVAR